MVTELKWPDTKVKGAIELCTKRRLTKKCLYSQEMKYLVLVTDKVESGSSRSRSLEQEMSEAGIWDTEFSLGDLINLDDESEGKKTVETKETKAQIPEFPAVDGPESLQEFLDECCAIFSPCSPCDDHRRIHPTGVDGLGEGA